MPITGEQHPDREPEILDAREAEEFSKLSLASLKRRAREGHRVGLRRRGRRLIFVLQELREYLTAADTDPGTTTR